MYDLHSSKPTTPHPLYRPMKGEPYNAWQARKNEEGDRDYRNWVKEQSPKMLGTLKSLGLDAPMKDSNPISDDDTVDSARLMDDTTIEDKLEGPEHDPDEWIHPDVNDALRYTIAYLQTIVKSLIVDCFAFEVNRGVHADTSHNAIARSHSVSVPTVRRYCDQIRNFLNQQLLDISSAEALRHAIAFIQPRANSLSIDCFAFTSELSIHFEETPSDIVERHGVCPARVSSISVRIRDELNLPPPPGTRALTTRNTCCLAQLKRSHRL